MNDAAAAIEFYKRALGAEDVMRMVAPDGKRIGHAQVPIGGTPAGAETATRPFQLVTGWVSRGTAFGGAKGRTDVPGIEDWYMAGKINIDDLITHTMPLERINDAFTVMHEGESIRSVVTFQPPGRPNEPR